MFARKRLALAGLLALALCAIVMFFPATASAGQWACTIGPGQSCFGGYNYWNHHYVLNQGSSTVYCWSATPNGTVQGSAWVGPGESRNISAWVYNHVVCQNHGTSQTTLLITDY